MLRIQRVNQMPFTGLSYCSRISLVYALIFLLILIPASQPGHGEENSLKFLKNYRPLEESMQPQNWAVAQDNRGIIYAANQGGLLEYDGVSWRCINIPNQAARSLAVDESGIIYVGGNNDIGFLAPAADGSWQYVSLVPYVHAKHRGFGNVWRAHAAKEGIYFWTSRYLFRWDPGSRKIKVWEPELQFFSSITCGGAFYILQEGVGLMKMVKDSLELVPGGEKFAAEKVCVLVPYDSRRLLIATGTRGLYLYDGDSFLPLATEVDDFLAEKQVIHGIRLSGGDFALATRLGGLVIIDPRGRLKETFNKASGLLNDGVRYICEDSQGNLWLALVDGLARIEYPFPITIYDEERSNLPGLILSVVRHGINNEIYAGTTSGLYLLTDSGKFHPVAGINCFCFSLLSVGDTLLAAGPDGVFQVENKNNNQQIRKVIKSSSIILAHFRTHPSRVYVGKRRGFVLLHPDPGNRQWTEAYRFEDVDQEIRTIVEDGSRILWLGTSTKGVLRLEYRDAGTFKNPEVTGYGPEQGLPAGEINVFTAAGHVMFATEKGIFRFHEKNKIFMPDTTLGREFTGGAEGEKVFHIAEDRNKNIWFHSERRNFQAIPRPDGSFFINEKSCRRIRVSQVNSIYADPLGYTIWFAGHKGLVRYDTRLKKNYDYDFPTLVRKVLVNEGLVFNGYKSGEGFKNFLPVIDYKDRNLRFEFAAPFFEAEAETRYQCLLEGYDGDWSSWTAETKKDYTNLDSGLYTFRVRAKNVYENISEADVFRFKILPPWYKTWWAFLSYGVLFFLIIFLVVRWRSRRLVREKQALEQVITERTKEIEGKNLQLQEQAEKLKEMDTVKSRFFANISHEFRTPLTLIMGPLEQMLSGDQEGEQEQKKKMRLMLRNSQRLLNLINQLLELSKFDSGKMELQAVRQNILPFLKGIFHSFDILAEQNEIELTFHTEAEDITLYFDPEKLEEVICNLLLNAVKFTPAGGRITVAVRVNEALPGTEEEDSLEISVSDTGPGIPRQQLAHIFDRFYQADTTYECLRKGSGIGLAIAKEIVELHHGTISVTSREGKDSGSEFVVRLALGDSHLKPGEIADLSPILSRPGDAHKIPTPYILVQEEEETEPGFKDKDIAGEAGSQGKDIILVVEDSADVREYIRGALEPLYMVVQAKDGRQGHKTAKEMIPDLIISDIMMPGIDGYELCRLLKKDLTTSHIPIILLTAKAAEENIIAGLETGADDYITKPFNTKMLLARIQNLIDLRRHLQEKVQRQMMLQPAEIAVSSMDQEFMKELQRAIEKNLADPEFGIDKLAKALYLSRATLNRKIQALTGESPNQFIQSYRLQRAAHLLRAKFGNVTEVAFEVGFSSSAYFTRCFKEKFHRLPSDFQAS